MSKAIVFEQLCQQLGLKYHWLGDGNYMSHFSGQNGKWQVFCCFTSTYFHCYSILPVSVCSTKQHQVMEYLTWANYGLPVGNFEMDLRDGEVRFKTGIIIQDGKLTPVMLGSVLLPNLVTTDRYLSGLQRVLFADIDPAVAVQSVEAAMKDEEPDEALLRDLLDDIDLNP